MSYSRFTIGLDSKLYERLKELKWTSRKSISGLIEDMINNEITRYEEHYKWIEELRHREDLDEEKSDQSPHYGKMMYRIKYKPPNL